MIATDSILLIDAYSQIYRGYFAIRFLSSSKNQPTNAIFAMAKLLLGLHKEYPTAKGAFAFDLGRPAFRLELAPAYKANRPPMPDDLKNQLPHIDALIEAFGWPIFRREGYEADDLLAGIVRDFPDEAIFIISADKDLAQLVSDRVKILAPDRKNVGFELRGPEEIREKFQVSPAQIVDYLALLGDSSDNIPGVTGVGPKTAAELIGRHGSLRVLIDNPCLIDNEKLREKIIAGKDFLNKNIKLITLDDRIPDAPWLQSSIARRTPDWKRIADIAREFELKSILQAIEMPIAAPVASDVNAAESIPGVAAPAPRPGTGKKFAPDLFDSF